MSTHLSENHPSTAQLRRPRRLSAQAYDRRVKLQSFTPTTYWRKSLNSEILTCSKRFLATFYVSQTLYFSFKCFWEFIPGKQWNKMGGCLQQSFTQNHWICGCKSRCCNNALFVCVFLDACTKTFQFKLQFHFSFLSGKLSPSVLTLPIFKSWRNCNFKMILLSYENEVPFGPQYQRKHQLNQHNLCFKVENNNYASFFPRKFTVWKCQKQEKRKREKSNSN